MDLMELRGLFPGVKTQIYFDISATGLIPWPVHRAAEQHLRERLEGTTDKTAMHASVERSRVLFASLIGAATDEVAITKNVSEGLNLFAAAVDWQPGDNVVLCPELEHPNNVFLWYNLRRLRGIEVRAVAPDDGRIPTDAVAAAIDDRTRIVTLPTISFSPGFVTAVRAIADVAHRYNALVLLDAAQSVGAVRTHVDDLGADGLAAATQKCLMGLYGYGFLYVRRNVADEMIPGHVARYGMDLGDEAGETARSGDGGLPYAPGARRFDLGNYNYLGARAAEAALELIHSIGIDRIETHVRALASRLATGLLKLGLPVAGGEPGPHLAHIVAVGQSGGGHHDSADDPRMNELHRWLVLNGVRHSVRKGVLRFAIGAFNDESDVDRAIELAREWVDTH